MLENIASFLQTIIESAGGAISYATNMIELLKNIYLLIYAPFSMFPSPFGELLLASITTIIGIIGYKLVRR